MPEKVDVAIIGGGQAGLSISYYLTQQGRNHVVLEQQRVGEAWRSGRWDSFTLVTPNWTVQLPGFAYQGDDPDGFMPRESIVDYFERYAAHFNAPVRTGIRVTSIEPKTAGSGYLVTTTEGTWEADNVVVATGPFQQPKLPPWSTSIPGNILQIHTGQYRNPAALPPGAVLVVGSGQSGCQVAEELHESGRQVYLSVGSAGQLPRRYRGKDSVWLLHKDGFFEEAVDKLPSPKTKFAGNPHLSGKAGGHTINLHKFARDGVVLLGHLRGVEGTKLVLAPDLRESLAKADAFAANVINRIDEAVKNMGLPLPEDPETREAELAINDPPKEMLDLDLNAVGISTIIWATGYVSDFSWVRLPIFDADGYPVQQRGVTSYPGLYFLGVNWLHTRKSALLFGVGDDAAYVADHIASRNKQGIA